MVFGDGKICRFFFNFFDFLSSEGIYWAYGHFDPPLRLKEKVKNVNFPIGEDDELKD